MPPTAGCSRRFTWVARRAGLFEELFFMGPTGQRPRLHRSRARGPAVRRGRLLHQGRTRSQFIQEPSYTLSLGKMTLVASRPVFDHGLALGGFFKKCTGTNDYPGNFVLFNGTGFIYSFALYFNQRFFELCDGIKQVFPGTFKQRPRFRGEDEFYEISLVFNEMAEKLKKNEQKMSVTLQDNAEKVKDSVELEELKERLSRIKSMEAEVAALISRIEKGR